MHNMCAIKSASDTEIDTQFASVRNIDASTIFCKVLSVYLILVKKLMKLKTSQDYLFLLFFYRAWSVWSSVSVC